ncbi:WLM-domain-containing protein [Eremomyces bilateralis CBS 781.70]|uniref:WLM-domain-containing protein n=1 Tax=Eremomyces bilateralis CBS 781.70 TaxID=1392243 RepID=A0A6G1FW39_9PEZI|nr:WLM-domain-containing protein [Eremomyces bilateralis CBS 781.70]KAF1809916.1 WLM-domain-containing protein [Eremomyces bilateralis CBS 781.70]
MEDIVHAPQEGDLVIPDSDNTLSITIHHHGKPYEFALQALSTVEDLSSHISTTLNIPTSNQKLFISPKPGILKPPFPSTSISALLSSSKPPKITLLASTASEIAAAETALKPRERSTASKSFRPTKTQASSQSRGITATDSATYTFATIRPLPYLPEPQHAEKYLRRLADDPGIRRVMAKHKFRVGLLTEMDPAAHTDASHEGVSRTLGLNRNGGEVIELRLRTDAGDGWRQYDAVRKTLCHELTHNVWGPHDSNFWKLCRELEKEVAGGDWWKGRGQTAGDGPGWVGTDEEEEHVDGGGWTGGSYVLGRKGMGEQGSGLSRREILAKAAEERARKVREAEGQGKRDGQGSSSPS